MITTDDSDAVLPDDQSVATATEQHAEVIEETTLSEEETSIAVVIKRQIKRQSLNDAL